MEQIELVVKLPKKAYDEIKFLENWNTIHIPNVEAVFNAIANGTPLPKGSTQAFSDEVDDYLERLEKYSDVCNDCAYTIATDVRNMAEKYIIGSEEEGADDDDSKGID